MLCLSEIVTNAIRHAGGMLDLRVSADGPTVRVEVEDAAEGPVAVANPEPTDTSGRGLLIVDTVASRWGASGASGRGKVVWFEVDRPPPPEGSAPGGEGAGAAEPETPPPSLPPLIPASRLGLVTRPRWLQVAAAVLGIASVLLVARWTADLAQPEAALAVSVIGLLMVVTLAGGFGVGALVAFAAGVGAFAFHAEDPLALDLSTPVLALGIWLGGVVVAAFTWSWGELRARARARTRLFERLTWLSAALTTIEESGDPVAEVEQLAAEAAGVTEAKALPTTPGTGVTEVTADAVVLPLAGPRRHRSLELRGAGAASRSSTNEERSFLQSVADRCAQALERVELRAAERRARSDVELLADASRALSESLDVERVIVALRSAVVPRLADRCAVLLDPDVRPGTAPPGADMGTAGGTGSSAALELRSRGRRLGRMVATRSHPPFDDEDLALLAELASRAAIALDNAQLYEEQAQSTGVLEGSLLPHALLPIPDLDVGARYLPATKGHLVGGDFYDSIRLPGGGVVLVVGDVQGKGVEAATLTAVARHTLRSAALAGEPPAALLEAVNQALRYHQAERDALGDEGMVRFITAAVAHLRPSETGFTATLACGGHPYPILVRPGGEVQHIQATGPLLGVFDHADCDEVELDLGLSDVLVLYTDGVTEHREAADLFDELQLGRLVRNQLTIKQADDLAQLVLDTVVELSPTESRDDIAVVVARVTGPR